MTCIPAPRQHILDASHLRPSVYTTASVPATAVAATVRLRLGPVIEEMLTGERGEITEASRWRLTTAGGLLVALGGSPAKRIE